MLEATTTDIRRKQKSIKRLFPDFDVKTKGVEDKGGLKLVDQDVDTWKFKVHSGTQDDLWYDNFVHFKNVRPTLERLVKDRRLWVSDRSRVDLRKLAKEFMDKVDVQLLCSCPADIFYGGHYIRSLGKYDAKYTSKELRSPRVRNPKQLGAVCKHLDRLLKALPFYQATAAKWISDFYGKDIAKWEKEAKAEFGWIKKIARFFKGNKKETPKVEPKVEGPQAEKPPEEEMF